MIDVVTYDSQMSGYEHTFSRLETRIIKRTSRGKTDLNGVGKGEKFPIYGKENSTLIAWVCEFECLLKREENETREKRIWMREKSSFPWKTHEEESCTPTKAITDTTKATLCITVRIECSLVCYRMFRRFFLFLPVLVQLSILNFDIQ